MEEENKKENKKSISLLWALFRKEVEEMCLPEKVIEGIKIRIKEKFSAK